MKAAGSRSAPNPKQNKYEETNNIKWIAFCLFLEFKYDTFL